MLERIVLDFDDYAPGHCLHSTAENNSMANIASRVNKVTSVHSDSTGTEELNIYIT